MSSMDQTHNDPWNMGPLTPVPRPVLTPEEDAEWEAWQDYVEHMQTLDIDQRTESDPNWSAPAPWPDRPVTWETGRITENEAEAEAEAEP
jgi:hypothetical protein